MDANASANQFVYASRDLTGTLTTPTATLRFYGDALNLLVRREPGAGRLFVTMDGSAVNGLSRDESGQSFVELANGTMEWRAVVPVVKGAPRREHVLEFRAEGPVNIDGFSIPAIEPPQPPWWLIGILGVLGIGCLVLAGTQFSARRKK